MIRYYLKEGGKGGSDWRESEERSRGRGIDWRGSEGKRRGISKSEGVKG